jgi:hypothetical protein
MYLRFHGDVSRLLAEDGLHFDFHSDDDDRGSVKEYDTTIMGRFICRNGACKSSGWSSKQVAITIRMYPGAQYNARVYHQRCRECNWLCKPLLGDSYAERVAYRLKKWSGIQLDTPMYFRQSKRPHKSNLCEGCKAGHCNQNNL